MSVNCTGGYSYQDSEVVHCRANALDGPQLLRTRTVGYQPQWLVRDPIAGVTLAIPVSLAYASLARLPPHYGIYCYLAGGLLYAIFGSSRQLAIGPKSAISMLVGVTVAGMAAGDPDRRASIAALLVCAMCVLAWLLRLSSLVSFISETMLLIIRRAAHPHVAFLGRIPGTRLYFDIDRNPDNEPIPEVLIFRESSLLNLEHVRAIVWERGRATTKPPRLVICDLSVSPVMDLGGACMLATLDAKLKAAGIALRLVAAHAEVRDLLRAEGAGGAHGLRRRILVADVVDEHHAAMSGIGEPSNAAGGL
ncbi:STAS domain-containing protein (plasmid) [Cupriavidus necator]|uniref:STAS domain-containing protein n=2 Tax=Cupriavidus necator TaxID=106590 RepID=A0A367PLF9_CUPNE|nr:STAS domain-containing protein [Cupriavidus necator]RCJ08364.1 STAS domain-containing protein [Cupriavidus necator]